jgi:hypothetical protein
MPIERATASLAAGEERAARYATGHWIMAEGRAAAGGGHLVALGDRIVLPVQRGRVASPGTWSCGRAWRCWPARLHGVATPGTAGT